MSLRNPTIALMVLGLAATGLAQAQNQPQAQAPSPAQADQQKFMVRVENIADEPLDTSQGPVPFTLSPGAWAVHTGVNPMYVPFESVQGMRGEGLEKLAEDGKQFQPLVKALKDQPGVEAAGIFNTPESKMEKGGLKPGMMYEFTIPADPGDQLTLATMFAESNDLFYAPYGTGIPLFSADGKPISGEVTSMLALWDAGTEENQEPGVGSAQPHRAKVGVGPDENKPVRPLSYVEDPYEYPETAQVIKVTITPIEGEVASVVSGRYQQWAGEDGELTVAEWDQAIDQRFGEDAVDLAAADWDADGDGVISQQEFEQAAAQSGQ